MRRIGVLMSFAESDSSSPSECRYGYAALRPPELLEPLAERRDAGLCLRAPTTGIWCTRRVSRGSLIALAGERGLRRLSDRREADALIGKPWRPSGSPG